ncbi:BON domain-containing protein [uncultured Desulfovibrio sp.]|uniref:BON domain-containing protein n=1 Tax=uncultured Desulfovibrio sp. TaxID=167968 RepID=UPI0025CD62E5|nr:BON domain-containing protein [uncultured Desulfovibrio sp.]
MRLLLCVLLLLIMLPLSGCGYSAYGLYDDKRLMDTITDDKGIATAIKTDLLDNSFSQGWGTAVYCYYGNVFLVGEVPQNMRDKAVTIARRHQGVRSVTTHWFSPATSETSDLVLSARLRTALIRKDKLSSTRIDTEVNAGRVVLLGVVENAAERGLALDAARHVEGVTSVKSYLMTPPTDKSDTLSPVAVDAASPSRPAGKDAAAGNDASRPASGASSLEERSL